MIDIDDKYCDLESINYYSQLSSQINLILMIAYFIYFVKILYNSYKEFKKEHKNNLLLKKNRKNMYIFQKRLNNRNYYKPIHIKSKSKSIYK